MEEHSWIIEIFLKGHLKGSNKDLSLVSEISQVYNN